MKRVVREIAEECNMPVETDKEEVLHLRKSRKKKNAERKYVKWLGFIFDDSLDFDIRWKYRLLVKARKALGALIGTGGAKWGMCPGGWKKSYEGMIRSIATWGAELGWSVGEGIRSDAVQGTVSDKVKRMTLPHTWTIVRFGSWHGRWRTHRNWATSRQWGLVTRECWMMSWQRMAMKGGGMITDRCGFVSTLTRAVSILPEGKPLWGGSMQESRG